MHELLWIFTLYVLLFIVIFIDYLKHTKKGLLSLEDWLVSEFYERTGITLLRNKFWVNLFCVFSRFWSKGCSLLLCILGLTWIIGIFYVDQNTIAFAYAFCVVNSLQGLAIFFFHCLCDPRVRAIFFLHYYIIILTLTGFLKSSCLVNQGIHYCYLHQEP